MKKYIIFCNKLNGSQSGYVIDNYSGFVIQFSLMKYGENIMEKVFLYNTLGRSVQEFKPIVEGKVGIYTCGPTVYGRAHIGNMRAYIFADSVRRVFEYAGYKVKHVMNITDVGHLTSDADTGDDKLEKIARETNQTAWEISKKWTKQFFEDTASLNIKMVSVACKATEHIKEQIELVKKLEEKGFTYRTSDGIYFDTTKVDNYRDLAQIDIDGLRAGIRIDMAEKRNKTDFAVWKFSNPNEKRDMEWDSPWGVGFPGWHIECSAMSMKYLGDSFDIHTGGVDHIPIHHTNEIAQSEGATGKKFVNYWMHSEFLVMSDAEKMSKSLGNIVNMDTLKKNNIPALAYRYLCLNSHYRKQLFYSKDILQGAVNSYNSLVHMVTKIKADLKGDKISLDSLSPEGQKYHSEFKTSVFNDLNIPQGLAVLWTLLKDNKVVADEKYALLLDFDRVLGLKIAEMKEEEKVVVELSPELEDLLKTRNRYRKDKNWAEADKVRDEITRRGYKIVDTKEGSLLEKI